MVALISMALACVTDDEKFNRALEKLTKTHNELGVKAYEYALVAETHFWTMRRVCGEAYGTSQHAIWTKIISRMLKVMVPSAVAYEIHSGGMHVEREKGNHTFSENISFELTVLYLFLSQRTLILLPFPTTSVLHYRTVPTHIPPDTYPSSLPHLLFFLCSFLHSRISSHRRP